MKHCTSAGIVGGVALVQVALYLSSKVS